MQKTVKESMQHKLTEGLSPTLLEISDNSAKHAGHAGHKPGGETHFALYIVSERFQGLNPLQRHRLVYGLVADEMQNRVHALEMQLKTQVEHNQ